MKLTLIAALMSLSFATFAKCDLALIRGQSNGQTFNFPAEAVNLLEDKGYRAYHVNDAYEAGLTNANYIGYFEASCVKNIFNPFMTSTVTTLTISREKGIKYESFFKMTGSPKVMMGSCHVDLMELVAKVPACK